MRNVSTQAPTKINTVDLRSRIRSGSVLVVAAGFERRARRVVELLDGNVPARVALARYGGGVAENEKNYLAMSTLVEASGVEWQPVALDPLHPDEFVECLSRVLRRWRPESVGDVWIDITALPMQGICAALAAIRETLPGLVVRVLYTEAREYFPPKREVQPSRGRGAKKDAERVVALSQEMSTNLIPKHFGGSSSEVATCLIVFAGYEKHRSIGVVDELNPSKLVLVFGRPVRPELLWRLKWSQRLHSPLRGTRPTAEEIVSTLNPWESVAVLSQYYEYLFADHNIAVSPICSKMQCVAAYLFWERYRDVQLVFPLPVSYLPQRFSLGFADTFEFSLPSAAWNSALMRAEEGSPNGLRTTDGD